MFSCIHATCLLSELKTPMKEGARVQTTGNARDAGMDVIKKKRRRNTQLMTGVRWTDHGVSYQVLCKDDLLADDKVTTEGNRAGEVTRMMLI